MARALLLTLLLGLVAGSATAAVDLEDLGAKIPAEALAAMDKKHEAKRKQNPLRSRITRYLEAAGDKLQEGDAEGGLELLERLNVDRLNSYEQANVYRLKGYMQYSVGNYSDAIDSFRRVLELEILPMKDEIAIRFYIGNLYAALAQWDNAVSSLRDWFRYEENPDPIAYYILAIAYYQQEDFAAAKKWGETAVDAVEEPKEAWLQLLAALYVREQDYASAAPVFEELVMRFPKKDYWVQLSLIYGARDDYTSSLAVQQIAYQQGFLTKDSELQRLARSYLYKNLPYPAAKVLAKGFEDEILEPNPKTYELLANAWIAAREYEKAVEPLTKAAEMAPDGALYVRLAQVNMQNEEWTEAARLIQKALDKGGFDEKKLASAHLLLGICLYNAHDIVPARSAFRQARRHDSMREQADAWITHITKELQSSEG